MHDFHERFFNRRTGLHQRGDQEVKPHITLGIITFVLDICTIILGTALVFKDIDGLIYGVVVTYLMAMVMDRIMYGIDEGKMTLIVTTKVLRLQNRSTLTQEEDLQS